MAFLGFGCWASGAAVDMTGSCMVNQRWRVQQKHRLVGQSELLEGRSS